ncbi:hypothetical protein Anas_03877 [Armadillidium nasatum]|uniref:Uncharacterized protein n=1 Tax=Armadillidium nasatum TaxID=96803 RepID=A0A5N5STE6_9CRUS|nr:hypothetical protein Anas_03877 [Armadillidium nasatum]
MPNMKENLTATHHVTEHSLDREAMAEEELRASFTKSNF